MEKPQAIRGRLKANFMGVSQGFHMNDVLKNLLAMVVISLVWFWSPRLQSYPR